MNIERSPNANSENPEDDQEKKENKELIRGVLTMISGNVPGYQGGLSGGEYHLRPLGPNEPLKGAKFRGNDSIMIIHDDVDISDLKPGDEVEYERKMANFHKLESSNHQDKKQWWIITSIKKIEK